MFGSPRLPINSDPSQRPRQWETGRALFPWVIALPILLITSHSYAKASYHAMVWAAVGALILCIVFAWWGAPFGRRFGPYGKRLKIICVSWGIPLALGIGSAFDLPAHYAAGLIVTKPVHYSTGSSRHCIVALRFYLKDIDDTVHTYVGRDEVGAVPGSADGVVTIKETPYGIELLKFQSN
jgi:hypothetical protein